MKTAKITVYKAKDGHRWRMVAPNGRIVAEGGESYVRSSSCFKAACRFIDVISAGGAVVVNQPAQK